MMATNSNRDNDFAPVKMEDASKRSKDFKTPTSSTTEDCFHIRLDVKQETLFETRAQNDSSAHISTAVLKNTEGNNIICGKMETKLEADVKPRLAAGSSTVQQVTDSGEAADVMSRYKTCESVHTEQFIHTEHGTGVCHATLPATHEVKCDAETEAFTHRKQPCTRMGSASPGQITHRRSQETLQTHLTVKDETVVMHQDQISQGLSLCPTFRSPGDVQLNNTPTDSIAIKSEPLESISLTATPPVVMHAADFSSDVGVENKLEQVVFPVGLFQNVHTTDIKGQISSTVSAARRLDTGECEFPQQDSKSSEKSGLMIDCSCSMQSSTSVNGQEGGEMVSVVSAPGRPETGECETLQQPLCRGETSGLMTDSSCNMQRSCAQHGVRSSRNLPLVAITVTDHGPFFCEKCWATCTSHDDLKQHVQTHHRTGEKRFVCEECGTVFRNFCSHDYHTRFHSRDKLYIQSQHCTSKPFVCKHCGAAFSRSSCLQHHMINHVGKPYACKLCDATFRCASSLKQHLINHTGETERLFVCKDCGAGFGKAAHLIQHVMIHSGEKPFVCKHCGTAFNTASSLKRHTRTHTGDKPFVCKVCEAAFSDSNSLKQHMMTHTGDKPFTCKQCGAAYKQSSHLKEHMQTHARDKPYKCNDCGRLFAYNRSFKRHMLTHSGD